LLLGTFLTVVALPVHAQTLAQSAAARDGAAATGAALLNAPARLQLEATPLPDALLALQAASGVRLAFSSSLLPDRAVSCQCMDLTVSEALGHLIANTGLRFEPLNGHVIVEPALEVTDAQRLPSTVSLVNRPPPDFAVTPVTIPRPPAQGTVTGRVTAARTGAPLGSGEVHIPAHGVGVRTPPTGR
jgi:hypothetical protein